jgi:hypothetical protein
VKNRSRRSIAIIIILIFVIGFAALVAVPGDDQDSEPVVLSNTYDLSPTAFNLDYPEDWIFQIPQAGILVFAPESTLRGTPGPALVVRRSELLAVGGGLDGALDNYLANGPLRPNRHWEITEERSQTTIGDREALRIELVGSELADAPLLHTLILVARAGNGVVYFISFTAPKETWNATLPIIDAIWASMVIVE